MAFLAAEGARGFQPSGQLRDSRCSFFLFLTPQYSPPSTLSSRRGGELTGGFGRGGGRQPFESKQFFFEAGGRPPAPKREGTPAPCNFGITRPQTSLSLQGARWVALVGRGRWLGWGGREGADEVCTLHGVPRGPHRRRAHGPHTLHPWVDVPKNSRTLPHRSLPKG